MRTRPITPVRLRREVYQYFAKHRRNFPWRQTHDAYRIFVSEIMLQQTQADRVVGKYRAFIRAFPTVNRLAAVSLQQVLQVWQGLGYNRRALYLLRAAQAVVREHGGRFPRDVAALDALPGVGQATACAIAAYAYNLPVVYIETNIRTIFIHCFFPRSRRVADARLLPLIEQALDRKNPRRWYTALMDYGTWLKREQGNASRRSKHYLRQSSFTGSNRQLRGRVVQLLVSGGRLSVASIAKTLSVSKVKARLVLAGLGQEQIVLKEGTSWRIA